MNFLKKIDILYVATLFFLLLASLSNFIAFNNIYWGIDILFTLAIAITRKTIGKKEITYILVFFAVYIVFVSVRDILINNLQLPFLISDLLYLGKFILLSYVFVVTLKEQTVHYLILVTVHLTILSFVLFILQIIGFEQDIYNLAIQLNLPTNSLMAEGYANLILFSVTVGLHDYRNSGFLWEPGSFGCFLVIMLLLNFLLNKFKFDRKSIILLIGVLTTFSTTDYLALLVLLFAVYRQRISKVNFWILLALPVVIFLIVTVPFLGDKVVHLYTADADDLKKMNVLEKYYHKHHQQVPLGRFSSMDYISETFGGQLILGYSNKYDAYLNQKTDVNISNGVFDFMARFGLVSLVYLFYCFIQYCYGFIRRTEILIYLGVVLFLLSFGEPILSLPICLIFLFLPFLLTSKLKNPTGQNAKGIGRNI